MSSDSLYLTQLRVDLPRLLRASHLSLRAMEHLDLGYLVHTFLDSMFGAAAFRPFVLPALQSSEGSVGHQRSLEVLGYSRLDAAGLNHAALEGALPELYAALDGEICSKPMPSAWPLGRMVRLGLRACPTVRYMQGGKQREMDAFLRAVESGAAQSREKVYVDWLQRELGHNPALRIHSVRVESFRLVHLVRRTQGESRQGCVIQLPEVWFDIQVEVLDSDAFARALARGVGRHRAFGFGMLLVRRAERSG